MYSPRMKDPFLGVSKVLNYIRLVRDHGGADSLKCGCPEHASAEAARTAQLQEATAQELAGQSLGDCHLQVLHDVPLHFFREGG